MVWFETYKLIEYLEYFTHTIYYPQAYCNYFLFFIYVLNDYLLRDIKTVKGT